MWKNLSNWLYRISTHWLTLAAILIFVLFSALVLPVQSAHAPDGDAETGSPDTSFFYSLSDLYLMAETYGPEGRSAYIRARFTFDVIWSLVYLLFLATTIRWARQRTATAPNS